jgi:hypothetical protein
LGHGPQDGPGQFLADVELTQLVRHRAKGRSDRLRVQGRAIGRDRPHRPVALPQRRLEAHEEGRDVGVRRVVIQDWVGQTLEGVVSDDGQHAAVAVLQLVGGDVAGEVGQGPIQLHLLAAEQLAKAARECGWKNLTEATAQGFTAFLDALRAKGRAPRTLNKYHQCASAFLQWCKSPPRRWLANNPLDGVTRAKGGRQARRRLRRAYAPAELARLLAAALARRRVVYQVAAYSGLRREELRRLRECDCDPTGPRPRWHLPAEVSKNGLAWNLPMLPECAAVLAQLPQLRN